MIKDLRKLLIICIAGIVIILTIIYSYEKGNKDAEVCMGSIGLQNTDVEWKFLSSLKSAYELKVQDKMRDNVQTAMQEKAQDSEQGNIQSGEQDSGQGNIQSGEQGSEQSNIQSIEQNSEQSNIQSIEQNSEQDDIQDSAQEPKQDSTGYVVVIDPGHQARGDSTKEPNGPDSTTMKARVTGGTSGRTTGVMEYELTLDISLQLRDELEGRGYTVYMTRETHDVNISNMERAQYASSVGADIAVRIHANGVDNSSVSGALALAPSSSNPYIANLANESQRLSQCILDSYCSSTGMNNQGVGASDTMTGINWSTVPVTILEMGYMTNPADDVNMEDEDYQQKMVQGIANGIDDYFNVIN